MHVYLDVLYTCITSSGIVQMPYTQHTCSCCWRCSAPDQTVKGTVTWGCNSSFCAQGSLFVPCCCSVVHHPLSIYSSKSMSCIAYGILTLSNWDVTCPASSKDRRTKQGFPASWQCSVCRGGNASRCIWAAFVLRRPSALPACYASKGAGRKNICLVRQAAQAHLNSSRNST